MKFSDFLLKRALNNNDYLVGCDSDGRYFRITVQDLRRTLGVSTVKAESVIIQYSTTGKEWHSTYAEGDRFMRVKCGSGAWSDAICISVSAYETWREANGGKGTVEEFLLSLKGEAGASVDVSELKLSEMDGYKDFIEAVEESIAATVSSYEKSMSARISKIEKQLMVLTTSERTVSALTGEQNGKNVTFTADTTFAAGTSQLYINGKRYVAGSDYLEVKNREIVLLTHVPEKDDVMVFVAVNAEQG